MNHLQRLRPALSRAPAVSFLAVLFLGTAALRAESAHKVQLNDSSLTGQLVAQGARLVADYGSYQLLEISQVPAVLTNDARVTLRDDYNMILLNAAHLDTTTPQARAMRQPLGAFSGKRLHLVQFVGPVQPAWHKALLDCGVEVVSYIPHNTYLVYEDSGAVSRLQALAGPAGVIQWDGPYLDGYKVHPAARPVDATGRPRAVGTDLFAIQLITDPAANSATLNLLEQLKLEPFQAARAVLHFRNLVVRLSAADLWRVATRPDVISIQPYFVPKRFDERQDQIVAGNLAGNVPSGPGYLAWLMGKGFTQAQFDASGFCVDLSDSGLDNGTTMPNHFGLYEAGNTTNASRVSYCRLEGTPNAGSTLAGCDGHGTLNAHIICGYDDLSGFPFTDSAGYHFGLGVCPFVKVGASVIFDPDNYTSPDLNTLQADAYHSGARISNNSWGSAGAGVYDFFAQNYDALVRDAQPDGSSYPTPGNQEMTIVFAVGNQGTGAMTVNSPGSAKNVITVGASANVQAFIHSDGCGVPDAEADNANDIAAFSSRGPCADGRHKPDLVAPGTHVSGGVAQAPNPGPTGTADPCFTNNAQGICGGEYPDIFFPTNQQFYSASSGTSHSTPCVSGACALARQFFINSFGNPASPAMTKAYLVNSARYLTGVAAGDSLWSDAQGMGELNLGTAFDGAARILRDELSADLFTASGQSRTYIGTIGDTNKPFRVTLAWTDAPGSTAGNAYNNNLDLVVVVGGKTYLGNVFQGQYSATGGAPDPANNVESVFLPAGLSGPFVVKVMATDINSDGVPGNASPLDQDFALVVYNGVTNAPSPVLNVASTTLLAESCSPTNGVIDAGETVTVAFALQNVGLANTANLVATLLPTGGVTSPSAAQTYGALAAGGGAVSQPFTFTAQANCGGTLTATLLLQDGAANLGTVSVSFPVGQSVPFTAFSQNFDSVSPPALPSGWSTSTSGSVSGWATTTALVDTPPNAVFTPDSASSGISELLSPVIPILSSSAQLSFSNYYGLESYASGGAVYDGGVLEIKIGSAPFTDIIAAGGSFVTGGYLGRIYSTGDNPLADRAAWSFNSGVGFISTIINLPPSAAGQNIQLKWRLGTDLSNSFGGDAWYIDTINIQDVHYTCCRSVPPPVLSGINVTRTNVQVSFNSFTGVQYTLQYKNGITDAQWLSLTAPTPGTGSTLVLTDTNAPVAKRFYRVMAN